MIKTIKYGDDIKVLRPFIANSVIIQSFLAEYNSLNSIDLYFSLYKNKNHNYNIEINIIDNTETVFFNKVLDCNDIYKTGYFRIGTDLFLTKDKVYYLYITCLGGGDSMNKFSFVSGYRTKMEQLFIDGESSLGELCVNFNYEVK